MLRLVRHSRGLFRAQTRFAGFSSASASSSPDVVDTPARIKRRFRERLGKERENALLFEPEEKFAVPLYSSVFLGSSSCKRFRMF